MYQPPLRSALMLLPSDVCALPLKPPAARETLFHAGRLPDCCASKNMNVLASNWL